MSIIIGLLCLFFMCSIILIFASFSIDLYNKKNRPKRFTNRTKDFYHYLFEVYDEK
ncbi:hypothetical protein [uncultured Metabacillus sp.]|uniref:hypothetical protein n=1 Tax=Metabacillus sp. Hm71 TaxID=3450743 RepID=UPI00262C6898|nr:hypothetical protein [uncultured Metabacillus sp.]